MFDPEFEEDVNKFTQMTESIRHIDRKEASELLHGEDGDMIYKYDLPVLNMPMKFRRDLQVVDEEREAQT